MKGLGEQTSGAFSSGGRRRWRGSRRSVRDCDCGSGSSGGGAWSGDSGCAPGPARSAASRPRSRQRTWTRSRAACPAAPPAHTRAPCLRGEREGGGDLEGGDEGLAAVVVGDAGLADEGDGRHQRLDRRPVVPGRRVCTQPPSLPPSPSPPTPQPTLPEMARLMAELETVRFRFMISSNSASLKPGNLQGNLWCI